MIAETEKVRDQWFSFESSSNKFEDYNYRVGLGNKAL